MGTRKPREVVQYTICGVPADVDQALRQKAARLKQSLNETILQHDLLLITRDRHCAQIPQLLRA